jgi:hypothetical protein
MATSGTYTEHLNNLTVIQGALRKIGRLGDFESFADTDVRYTSSLPVLKAIVKHWAHIGMPLWTIEELSIPLSNFTTIAGITIGLSGATVTNVSPMKIIGAVRRDSTEGIDVAMEPYTQDEYLGITQKDVTGAPLRWTYYPDDQSVVHPEKSTLKVWPLPDSYWTTNGAIYIRYHRPFQDVGTSTQDLDFPSEFQRAIIYTLACDLAPDYGLDITSRTALGRERDKIVAEAESYLTEEGSIRFQPARRR